MNDLKTIRQLIKMMVDNDLTEIDLEGDGEKIKLKRGTPPGSISAGGVSYLPTPAAAPAAPAAPVPTPSDAAGDGGDTSGGAADDDLVEIVSPMVGTFYTASNPDAEAFVSDGEKVKPDTVVCIVEAMKVFNEIKAECSGTIVETLVKNGDAVEYGQPLYRVRP
ncbi:MAG: acetyl-CoA carboxylase biotin carboxyl carrier protein [Planctomycetota bacterium]